MMTRPVGAREPLARDLIRKLGPAAVTRDPASIRRFLRDNSWLSPILSEHFGLDRGADGGPGVDADMVVTPASVDELRDVIALAVRHRSPIILRGGGTTNFGQSIPLEGGIVVDARRLSRILEITDTTVTAEAGALQGDVDAAARAGGRELTVLVTTYASATAAGWVAGGHVGLGGATYGTIWDGNVAGVRLLTAEDPPREIVLSGDDVFPVLRTSGTTGVITEVAFPLIPARRWLEAIVAFDTFAEACDFVDRLSERREIAVRAAAAQEAPLPTAFSPIAHLYAPDHAVVVLIVDVAAEATSRDLAAASGGRFHRWQCTGEDNRMPLAYLSYGHRMLWAKKLAPTAGFLNCYLAPERYRAEFDALKHEFGDGVLLEHKYLRSPWLRRLRGLPGEGVIPAPLLTVVPGDREHVVAVMRFCDAIGVGYQNPHTFSVAESGMFADIEPIVEFARQVDPRGLLNPGKLRGTFFQPPSGGAPR